MPKVWNKRDPNTPKDAIYVGRPTKWGNPFEMGKNGTRLEVVEKYANHLIELNKTKALYVEIQEALRGKDLVCWCAPKFCHADILLVIANYEAPEVLTVTDDLHCPKCNQDLSEFAALIGCPNCKTILEGFGCRKYAPKTR